MLRPDGEVVCVEVAAQTLLDDGPMRLVVLARDVIAERLVTAIAGRITLAPGGFALELVAAGHPAPVLVRADGRAEALEVSGTVLGIVPDLTWRPAHVTLTAGERIVLHTDGVTESRRPEALEPAGLAALLAAAGPDALGRSAGDLAHAVRRRAEERADGALPDDLAIVALAARLP